MSILNHLMQAAAVLLLFELLVMLLLFLGLAGGLAFGLRWGRGKLGPALRRGDAVLQRVGAAVGKGLDYAARPFILASGLAETIKGTAEALRGEVQRRQAAVPAIEETQAVPTVRE